MTTAMVSRRAYGIVAINLVRYCKKVLSAQNGEHCILLEVSVYINFVRQAESSLLKGEFQSRHTTGKCCFILTPENQRR